MSDELASNLVANEIDGLIQDALARQEAQYRRIIAALVTVAGGRIEVPESVAVGQGNATVLFWYHDPANDRYVFEVRERP